MRCLLVCVPVHMHISGRELWIDSVQIFVCMEVASVI